MDVCIAVDVREMDCYMGVIVVLLRVTFWGNTVNFVPEIRSVYAL